MGWLMDNPRFLECLNADYARILAVAPGHLDAQVPTCPDWTVADLVRHLATVYLHKAATMREGRNPDPWPPAGIDDEEPVALLKRAHAELTAEFSGRKADEFSPTWYERDQTVGFWIRRMAQETVIHRIDAELGAAAPVAPIPDDLAVDGIDELLKLFVAYEVEKYPSEYTELLAAPPPRTYLITAGTRHWAVQTAPQTLIVEDAPVPDDADATISGGPTAVLRWAWNRETPNQPSAVTITGNPDALATYHQIVVAATQ